MPAAASNIMRRPWFLGFLGVVAVGGLSGYVTLRGRLAGEFLSAQAGEQNARAVAVKVVLPLPGGIDRICNQPGSVEPIECADLYAKVSGYLIEQAVDIGYPVKKGQVLACISAPELEKQVDQDKSDLERAVAKVEQMKAAIVTAHADHGAALAGVSLAQAEKQSKASYRDFRRKQLDRVKELLSRDAIDAKLVDEQENFFQAAYSAELAAEQGIVASKQKAVVAEARVKQAEADLRYAATEVNTAQAHLEKAQVIFAYTKIRSPYTGKVSKRNFHPGDFVRSADQGGDRVPVLTVERTDRVRVIIQVPERDVPLVDLGDPATLEFDALPGKQIKSCAEEKVEVSRLASSLDLHTRMMRTEVHLKNPEDKLCRGMFGRVKITLQAGAPGALRVPSAALVGKAEGGKATVRVVEQDKVVLVPITYGIDNGTDVEILSGLTPSHRVIVHASGPVSDGTPIVVLK